MKKCAFLLALPLAVTVNVDQSLAWRSKQLVNGTCGPSNGVVLNSAPTTGLCTTGTPSAVSGTGQSSWTCAGSNGGTTAQCSTAAPTSGGGTGTGTWWRPAAADQWQWMIAHPLDVTSASDMGTGKTAYYGTSAPTTDPVVYDIDGFDNPATTVAALHAKGKKVVCYIEVGAAESYRPDYSQFPAAALGNAMPGYSSERYVDIRNSTVIAIIKNRIQMCASKGFDAIEPDIDESYTANTGFPLTKAIEEAYMTTLANYAHSLGLAMFGKNPDDTGDSYAADMVNVFDAVLTEQCNQYGTCSLLNAYTGKKAVFNAEYSNSLSAFCPPDTSRAGWNGAQFPTSLSGARSPCK
jgi:hypothetical protein